MMHSFYRDRRDMCVTCAGQCYRDRRDTPLGGVTIVTLARAALHQVPMPPFCLGRCTDAPTSKATHTGSHG